MMYGYLHFVILLSLSLSHLDVLGVVGGEGEGLPQVLRHGVLELVLVQVQLKAMPARNKEIYLHYRFSKHKISFKLFTIYCYSTGILAK